MPGPNLLPVDVPLSTFLGLNTEVSPPDCPEGVSPDNQDVMFIPGNVFSRFGLHRLFSIPFPGNPGVTYQKTFVQPNEDPLNLFLTSDGILWEEDVLNTPGIYAKLGQFIAGAYAASITQYGREYIAFSDGQHGVGVPLQFDGTNLDRVSQDGPGAAPTVSNYLANPATISGVSTLTPVNITNITPTDSDVIGPPPKPPIIIYESLTVVTAAPHLLTTGDIVTIAGNSLYNFPTGQRVVVIDAVTFKLTVTVSHATVGTGGTMTSQTGTSLVRANNVVLAQTAAAHGFQIGWQILIAGIANTNIGGVITAASRDGNGVSTITTTIPHGLPVGANIAITGVTDTSFNGIFVVTGVPSALKYTFAQAGAVATSSSGQTADIWTGTFFIQSIPTSSSFTYLNVGPDDSAVGAGTATPVGQLSAGTHLVVQSFLTRSGYITKPSPVAILDANGLQQLKITNLAIGPDNVVGRVIGLTGSGGDNFFTQLTAPQEAGQIIGTSLLIPDNTTTAVILDIADNSLFSGLGIDIPGNNLFALVVLGPVLGFFGYASRLATWGEYNKVQNFLNMGFDGGSLVQGWDTSANTGGLLARGGSWAGGRAWLITGDGGGSARGLIGQPAYQDENGVPIILPLTTYTFRLWAMRSLASTSGNVFAEIYSATSGVLAQAFIPLASIPQTTGSFVQANFSAAMPAVIPSDTVLRIYTKSTANGQVVTLDEIETVYQLQPFYPLMRVSYVRNLEAFDGVTGTIGPENDPNPIRGPFEIRNTMYILTSQRLHSTSDNKTGEPGTWDVPQVGNNCGALSFFGITSHREESGEEWAAWASDGSARIFGGGEPSNISQEIQTEWDQINLAAAHTIWTVNDSTNRRLYFGLPMGASTAPNRIQPLDYRELDTSGQIAGSGSIHISFTRKMVASDLARKWTRWNVYANCGAILERPTGPAFCLGGGNGMTPGLATAFGNSYTLDPAKLTDDDYGAIVPYYTLYAFVNHEMEQMLGCGSHRKLYKSISLFVSGVGFLIVTPLADSLTNPWTSSLPYPLGGLASGALTGFGVGGYGMGGYGGQPGASSTGTTDDIYIGMNVSTERCFFKIQVVPISGQTDVQFNLQKFVATLVQHPYSPVGSGAGI